MSGLVTIKFNETPEHKIKKLIDIAGFKSETTRRGFQLIDKNRSSDYADLYFRSLADAVKCIQPFLIAAHFKIVF
jgi:hypothetical protein